MGSETTNLVMLITKFEHFVQKLPLEIPEYREKSLKSIRKRFKIIQTMPMNIVCAVYHPILIGFLSYWFLE